MIFQIVVWQLNQDLYLPLKFWPMFGEKLHKFINTKKKNHSMEENHKNVITYLLNIKKFITLFLEARGKMVNVENFEGI